MNSRRRSLGVRQSFAESCEQHKRKFEPFALVDRHDADCIGPLGQQSGLADVRPALPVCQKFRMAYKLLQSAVVLRFKGFGFIDECTEVRMTLGTAGNGTGKDLIPGIVHQFSEKVAERAVPHFVVPRRKSA